jgi:hypothetical protein
MTGLTNRKLLLINFGLLGVSLCIATALFYLDDSGARHLNGDYVEPKSQELITAVVRGLIISMPILSLVLGLVTAIFIEKDKPYRQRYVKSVLLTLGTIYLLYSIMGLINIVRLM